MVDLDACADRGRDLVTFADGLDDSGMHDTARRLRLASYDVADLVDELRAERSARQAAQQNYRRCLSILGERADRAVSEAVDA